MKEITANYDRRYGRGSDEGVCSQGVSVNMTPSMGSYSSASWHKSGETEECAVEKWRAGSRTDDNEGLLLYRIMENMGLPDR